MQTRKVLFIAALGITSGFVLGISASSAGTLTTPALFTGGAGAQNVCVVINVGTTPADVAIQMIGLSSSVTETCSGETAVQPNDINSSCQASLSDFAFCKVTSTKSRFLKAVMMNRLMVAPFTINATVEAR